MRVCLVDDHQMVRMGLRAVLASDPGIEIVGEAGTADEALARVAEHSPDLVLLDVRMGNELSFALCTRIREQSPETRVVFLTSYTDQDWVFRAISAGAQGYLLKDVDGEALIKQIHIVHRGGSIIDPQMTEAVFARMQQSGGNQRSSPMDRLSAQERRILGQVAQGKTNKEVAEELHLKEKTVKNYLSSVLTKLGVSRRTEAAVLYTRYYGEDATGQRP